MLSALAAAGVAVILERLSRPRKNAASPQLPLPFRWPPPPGWPQHWISVVQEDFSPSWAENYLAWMREKAGRKYLAEAREVVAALVEEFLEDYRTETWRKHHEDPLPWDINCGDCEDFAVAAERALSARWAGDPRAPEMGLCSVEELAEIAAYLGDPPPAAHPLEYAHVILRVGDHFFDSQNPGGVRDWRDLQLVRLTSRDEHRALLAKD